MFGGCRTDAALLLCSFLFWTCGSMLTTRKTTNQRTYTINRSVMLFGRHRSAACRTQPIISGTPAVL
ncbi:hypothetical protein PR001_g6874 [Phytophthora rubi]|nr:hypothetical protein PR002_g7375 [Phytophthora rubi]KAE9040889.1 hypothetical protein PR001_g6874 [Phytophthora rubi]